MVTTSALQREEHTLLGGIHELWLDGSWGLSIIVFIASIAVPVLKIGVLGPARLDGAPAAALAPARARAPLPADRGGRPLVDARRLRRRPARRDGPLRPARQRQRRAGPARRSPAVVVLTLFATWSFDPRLIWRDPPTASSRRWKTRLTRRSKPPGEPGGPAPAKELPQPRIVRARRWNVSLVWLVPAVAVAIAASMLVRTVFLDRPAHRDRVQVRRRRRGRQDRGPLQGSRDRQGRRRSACATTARASSSSSSSIARRRASRSTTPRSGSCGRASARAASAASARCSRAPTSAPTRASRPSRAASSSASRRRRSCCAASPARSSCCAPTTSARSTSARRCSIAAPRSAASSATPSTPSATSCR